MNPRVAEIMRSHGLHKYISEDCQNRIEIVAELIIKECADICDRGGPTQMTCGGAADKIRNHFGVE